MGSMEDALRKAGLTPAAAEPLAEKACARCGKQFQPARPQHRLCEECATAVRAERAAGTAARPAGAAEAKTPETGAEAAASRPARPPATERRPRRERPPWSAEALPTRFLPRELPTGYLADGYFTPDGALRKELFTAWAEQIAQGIAAGSTEATASQLRLFANTVKRAGAAVKYGGKPVDRVLNEIQKMKAFAAERASRRKVPELFRRFIEVNVDHVGDARTLAAFAQHFGAVEAYAGGLLQSRKERR